MCFEYTTMKLHQDYEVRVWVETEEPLRRRGEVVLEGDDGGAATGVVRYGAGAEVECMAGEMDRELLVLEGAMEGEGGTFPAGCYVRLPSGDASRFTTSAGCVVFYKRRRGVTDGGAPVVYRTQTMRWSAGMVRGLEVMGLPSYGEGNTALVKWAPGTVFNPHKHWGGEEIFVLEGVFRDEHGDYPKGTWIRSPHLSQHTPYTGPEGAVILVKTGHLP